MTDQTETPKTPTAKPAATPAKTAAPKAGTKPAAAAAKKPAAKATTNRQAAASGTAKPAAAKKTASKPAASKASPKKPAAVRPDPKTEETVDKASATLAEQLQAAEEAVEMTREEVEKAVKKSSESMTQTFERTLDMTTKTMTDMASSLEEIHAFNRDNVEAVIAAGTAATKGMEALNALAVGFAQASLQNSQSAFKAMTEAKNIKEVFDIQRDFITSHYEKTVDETAKFNSDALSLVKDVAEPINARFSVALEKATTVAPK